MNGFCACGVWSPSEGKADPTVIKLKDLTNFEADRNAEDPMLNYKELIKEFTKTGASLVSEGAISAGGTVVTISGACLNSEVVLRLLKEKEDKRLEEQASREGRAAAAEERRAAREAEKAENEARKLAETRRKAEFEQWLQNRGG